MTNDQLLAAVLALPAPDLLTPTKIDDQIGAGAYYRADTVAGLLLAKDSALEKAADEIERLQKLLTLQQQSYEREIALEVAAERERLRALVQAVRDANAADSAPRMLTARQEAAWVALMEGLDWCNAEGKGPRSGPA